MLKTQHKICVYICTHTTEVAALELARLRKAAGVRLRIAACARELSDVQNKRSDA